MDIRSTLQQFKARREQPTPAAAGDETVEPDSPESRPVGPAEPDIGSEPVGGPRSAKPAPFLDIPEHPRIGRVSDRPVVPVLSGVPTALPSLRADAGMLGGHWVAAASVTGLKHQVHGTTGQDAFGYTVTRDGSALVLVACDGLGSRPLTAQIGAELITRLLLARAAGLDGAAFLADPPAAWRSLAAAVNDETPRISAALLPGVEDQALSSTVSACWVSLAPDRPEAHAFRIGDGNVVGMAGTLLEPHFPIAGGAINEVTGCLPHPNAIAWCEYARIDTGAWDLLAVTTDGIALDIAGSAGTRKWLAERWAMPSGAARMIETLRYRREGSHDDRTAAVVWFPRARHATREAAAAPVEAPSDAGGPETPDLTSIGDLP